MKVVITGNTGTGKSSLCRKIADKYNMLLIRSCSCGHAGDQATILKKAMMNHIKFARSNNAVMDRCILDVYAYEWAYLDCENLKKIAIETTEELADNTIFIVLSQQKRAPEDSFLSEKSESIAKFTEDILKKCRCCYILT